MFTKSTKIYLWIKTENIFSSAVLILNKDTNKKVFDCPYLVLTITIWYPKIILKIKIGNDRNCLQKYIHSQYNFKWNNLFNHSELCLSNIAKT